MRNYVLYLVAFLLSVTNTQAQFDLVDFEAGGLGAGWTWVVDQNDSNPAVTFPANPDMTGINTSATAMEFVALQAGFPWALTFTDDISAFTFDASNSMVKIMVNKPVISDVAIKFEGTSTPIEIKVANTVTNQWEELTFDFSSVIGNSYDRLVIIPDFDFAGRTQDNTILIDNITVPSAAPAAPPCTACDCVDFEAGGLGAAWTWIMDQNGSNPPLTFPANPDASGINTSATVAEFTAEQAGQPWALTYTDDIDEFIFDASNSTVTIMVYKPTISDVAIKFEGTSTPIEIKVPNTLVNEWEELTFDFSGSIGNQYDRLVVIPDFVAGARAQDNLLYFDNLKIPDGNIPPPPPPVVCTTCDCVDFEAGGLGASWTWVMDQNGSNPPLTFPANPVPGGINTSATVAEFTALQAGQPWALTYTDDIDEFMFDATNNQITIMVYKPTISDVAIKFEGPSPAVEIKVANTVINQWEELTFDFSGSIGNQYNRLVVIPDFDFGPRTQDNLLYFDNIKIPDGNVAGAMVPTVAAPAPSGNDCSVTSIFSEVYGDLAGTDFDPNWGQLTEATIEMIGGNNTLQYMNLNYQGTQFGSNQDVSNHTHIHVDFWTDISTILNFYVISPGMEVAYDLIPHKIAGQWVSVDIPLTHFAGGVDLTDVFQFKVDGDGHVWFDNLYFHGGTPTGMPAPTAAAPAPSGDDCSVTSVFGEVYGDLAGTNYDPDWGQSTIASVVQVAGNNTLEYLCLNYQGTQLPASQDVSGHDYLHLDFWTDNSTALNFYLISAVWPASSEFAYDLIPHKVAGQWVSIDIPLTHYANNGVDISDITQFKVDGDGNVWFDNIYFHGGGGSANVALPAMSTPTTIVCVTSCDDGDWTYYEDPSNPGDNLFAIEWDAAGNGSNAAAKAGAQVTIDVDATFATMDNGTNATWAMGRYWNVTPGAALVDPVNVKFFYDPAEKTAIENEMNSDGRAPEGFEWFKTVGVDYDPAIHVTGTAIIGGAIALVDMNTGALTENGQLYAQFDGITSFSGGTGATGVGPADSPLPVVLDDLRATLKGDNVELTWKTLSELNNDYFEVERSQDGQKFDYIGMTPGFGTTNTIQHYNFLDREAQNGINYYRLKQIDYNGDFHYSDIVSVRISNDVSGGFTLYPIPVRDELNIEFVSSLSENVNVIISNSIGEVVKTQIFNSIEGNNTSRLDVSELSSGTYFVRLQSNTMSLVQTIIKD